MVEAVAVAVVVAVAARSYRKATFQGRQGQFHKPGI